MGWIIPSLGSLAAGAADDAILRERRGRRRVGGSSPTYVVEDELARAERGLIEKIQRLPRPEDHVRIVEISRPKFRG